MTDEKKQVAVTTPTSLEMNPAEIWNSFQAMASDPNIDPAKMQTLYDVQRQILTDMRQEEFNRSKFAAMAEMPTIIKNKVVNNRSGEVMYRYSDFKHLYATVKPILSKYGLVLDFDVDEVSTETKIPFLRVAPILRHQNGYVWNGSYMPVPITTPNSTVTLTQAAKGAVETGKRTVTISCLGITEDEDPSITGKGEINMNVDEQKLWDDGMMAAAKGLNNYQAWFRSLTNVQKGWLIDAGKHEKLKSSATKHDK